MAASNVKSALKQAKECIQAKKFEEAIQFAEQALSIDENNYHALVFLGKACENVNKLQRAFEAYSKASELMPQQILAWQGLVSYYETVEKKADYKLLLTAYGKVLELSAKDDEKSTTLKLKMASLHSKAGDFSLCCDIYQSIVNNSVSNTNGEKLTEIHGKVVTDLWTYDSGDKLLLQSMEHLLSVKWDSKTRSRDDMCRRYIKIARIQSIDTKVVCGKLHELAPDSPVPLEILLSHSLESAVFGNQDVSNEVTDLLSQLEKLSPGAPMITAFKVLNSFKSGNYQVACNESAPLSSSENTAIRVLILKCYLELHNTSYVIANAPAILKDLSKMETSQNLDTVKKFVLIVQARAYLYQNDKTSLTEAAKICKQLKQDFDSIDVDILLCYVCIDLGNLNAAGKICERLKSDTPEKKAVIGWYKYNTDDLENAKTNLESAVDSDPKNALFLYHLCRVYWKMLETVSIPHQQCLSALMKTAKLDPYYSDVFLYIGHYFDKYSQNLEKTMKCYQKAYDLKPTNDEAAECLVDSLNRLGREDDAFEILKNVTENASAGSSRWAWLQLGLYQVKRDPSAAIQCFQSAIRSDPKDAYCWQCLAEAYMNRGSYNAAMKTFTKANELDPDCMYNLFQLATIKQLLGLHLDSMADYESILRKSGEYVPALKGLAETHIEIVRDSVGKYYSAKAVDHCQTAIGYLTRAVTRRPDLANLWKLIGEACTLLANIPDDVRVQIPAKLSGKNTDEKVTIPELLALGARSYAKAIQITDDDSVLWYDMGVNYYYQATVTKNTALYENAVNCLKKSLSLRPHDSEAWASLGVIFAKTSQYAESQHSLIRAVELDSQNAAAWANLGVLYLRNDNINLAHEAFKSAQSSSAECVCGWIGQAMVAETISHAETADLYRHSTELQLHDEALLGYAFFVAQSLEKGEKISAQALANACDGLQRYVDMKRDNLVAFNTYALLLERRGLYRTALEAIRKAVELDENSENDQVYLGNYARILSRNGNYNEAAGVYRKLNNNLGLGLALFEAKEYGKSQAAFAEALKQADENDKAEISALMGLCSYWSGDVGEAKTHLFASVQSQPPCVNGLISLLALSLLESDGTLALAVVAELEKISNEHTLGRLICQLMAVHSRSTEDRETAVNYGGDYLKTAFSSSPILSRLEQKVTGHFEPNQENPAMSSGKSKLFMTINCVEVAFRYAHNGVVLQPDQHEKWVILLYALVMNLQTRDFNAQKRYLSAISFLCENRLKMDKSSAILNTLAKLCSEFALKITDEIPTVIADDMKFLVEMMELCEKPEVKKNETETETETENESETPDDSEINIDCRSLLVHGLIQILTVKLKSSATLTGDLLSDISTYKSVGIYDFDRDSYERDLSVYKRKKMVKKNSVVTFNKTGLISRARVLVYDLLVADELVN